MGDDTKSVRHTPAGEVGMGQTRINFGCSPEFKQKLEEVAADQEIPVSKLVRDALASYIGIDTE